MRRGTVHGSHPQGRATVELRLRPCAQSASSCDCDRATWKWSGLCDCVRSRPDDFFLVQLEAHQKATFEFANFLVVPYATQYAQRG